MVFMAPIPYLLLQGKVNITTACKIYIFDTWTSDFTDPDFQEFAVIFLLTSKTVATFPSDENPL